MDIRIKMTEEEAAEFEKLDEQQQQDFFEGVKKRREQLMLKTAVASMFLVECFDELETLGVQKHKLRQLGNQYNTHLVKFMDKIFDINEDDNEGTEYLNKQIAEMHKLF